MDYGMRLVIAQAMLPVLVSPPPFELLKKEKGNARVVKGKSGDRTWKSQNFPASYSSDQATPALHDQSSSSSTQSWWDDHELGSAAVDDDPTPVPLHPDLLNDYVEHNNFDEDEDECISDYIDLILFAIVTQMERFKTYLLNPTIALLSEIRTHDLYISNAESSLNVHIIRIIHNFKVSVNYDACMPSTQNELTDAAKESKSITIEIDDLTQSPTAIDDALPGLQQMNRLDTDNATQSKNNETYKAIEPLNEIDNANASKNYSTYNATAPLNETDNANASKKDETYNATEPLNEIDNANASKNYKTYNATARAIEQN
jgi:hypothetical protein